MTVEGPGTVAYRRSRFATRLPRDRRYTAAHYWLLEEAPDIWRVGFTQFATRMLGDLVECEFPTATGSAVSVGEEIGSVEGFKAITVIFSVAEGEFLGASLELRRDITGVETDPYGRGWLYRVRGRPDPDSLDVDGYVSVLDATIDKLIDSRHEAGRDDEQEDDNAG